MTHFYDYGPSYDHGYYATYGDPVWYVNDGGSEHTDRLLFVYNIVKVGFASYLVAFSVVGFQQYDLKKRLRKLQK